MAPTSFSLRTKKSARGCSGCVCGCEAAAGANYAAPADAPNAAAADALDAAAVDAPNAAAADALMLRRLMHWMLRRLMRRMLRRLMGRLLRRLMHRMVHGLAGLHRGRRGRAAEPAKLNLHQPRHRLELGLEVLEFGIMLALELLDELFEFSLVGVDLVFKQTGPVLQIPADITHCLPLVR